MMNRFHKVRAATGSFLALAVMIVVAACPPIVSSSVMVFQGFPFVLDTSGRVAMDSIDTFAMDSTGVTQPGRCRPHRPAPDDSAHVVDADLQSMLIRNDYCNWMIPEANDEQRFRVAPGGYGPYVATYATPWVGNYKAPADFAKYWVNVAIVGVRAAATDPLPPEYAQLTLAGGLNCIYLHYDAASAATGASSGWTASVVPIPTTARNCIPERGAPIHSVPVVAETPSAIAADYPPVTRFVEGVGGGTYIGVRCGAAWCDIGAIAPANVAPATHADGKSQAPNDVRWNIKGWFDDQHLGNLDPTGSLGMRPGDAGSLVPSDTLRTLTVDSFVADWKRVATIYMPLPPTGKYGPSSSNENYGLYQGMTDEWIHATVTTTPSPGGVQIDTVWMARFGPHNGSADARVYPVKRVDHSDEGLYIPPTARWRWLENDEQMWVACYIGCCRVIPTKPS